MFTVPFTPTLVRLSLPQLFRVLLITDLGLGYSRSTVYNPDDYNTRKAIRSQLSYIEQSGHEKIPRQSSSQIPSSRTFRIIASHPPSSPEEKHITNNISVSLPAPIVPYKRRPPLSAHITPAHHHVHTSCLAAAAPPPHLSTPCRNQDRAARVPSVCCGILSRGRCLRSRL